MTSLRSPLRSSLRSPLYSALTGKYGGSTILGYGTGAAAWADTLREEPNVFAARAADDSCVVREFGLVDTETELVTNGTFDTDLTGWTAGDAASLLSWESGKLRITNDDGSGAWAKQTITTVVGKTYVMSVDFTPGTVGAYNMNATGNAKNGNTTSTTMTFTASTTATVIYIQLAGTALGAYADFDNISVKAAPITEVNGRIDDILNYTSATPKLVFGWDGLLAYNAHNMFLNSGTPATQSITVTSGLKYKVKVTGGTTSVALSGAGTGTASDGSPVEITASTTTLTCTVSGSGGTVQVFRSPADETYVATTSAIRWYLPVDWDPATLVTSSTSALIINGVVGLSKTFTYTGNVFTVGADVRAYDSANPETNYLVGKVTATASGSVTIQVFRSVGTGTISSWKLIQCKGWLVEPAATNLISNQDLTAAVWLKNGVTLSAGATGKNGSASTRITGDGATINPYIKYNVTQTAASTFAFFAKAGTGSFIQFLDSSSSGFYANFDLSTGVVGTVGANTTSKIKNIGDGWYWCQAAFDYAVTTSDSVRLYLVPSSGSGYASAVATTDYVDVQLPQLETGSIPTSPIITAGSSLNRLADAPYVDTADIPFGTNHSVVISATPKVVSGSNYFVSLYKDASNHVGIAGSTNYKPIVRTAGAFIAVVSAGASAADTFTKIAIAAADDDYAGSVDGASAVTDTSGAMPTGLSTINIGYSTSTSQLNGHIGSIKYLPRRVSNTELQSEATL